MAKGVIAKSNIIEKLEKTFGADWVGEVDKKYYVWADDGGERVQISISLTCPKNPVGAPPQPISQLSAAVDIPFELGGPSYVAKTTKDILISEIEQKNIEELMRKLNL